MPENQSRKFAVAQIVDLIRAAAEDDGDPSALLQDVQSELQTLPGAMVSFSTRDISWIKQFHYNDDRLDMSDAELQRTLFEASMVHDECAESQDHITTHVVAAFEALDADVSELKPC